jgi:Copper transport outer membrane protein, MctB
VFDFRYHALSLVAVLVALGIGLLLGVAVGDKELVGSAQTDLAHGLRHDVNNARAQSRTLQKQLKQRQEFEEQAFPALVENQLVGQRVGLVFMGGASRDLYDNVRDAVVAAGGELRFTAGVREPPDIDGLAGRATGTRFATLADDNSLLRPFAERTGRSIAAGGALAGRIRSTLFDSFSGELDGVDAVVVARQGDGPGDDEHAGEIRDVEEGLVDGLNGTDIPVVGAERTDTDPSHVSWYRDRGVASVDDVDDVAGRVALVYALAGRADGAYGVKGSAEGILPRVVEGQVPTTTTG